MMKTKVRRFLLLQKPRCHHLFLPHQIRSLCGKIMIPKVNWAGEEKNFLPEIITKALASGLHPLMGF